MDLLKVSSEYAVRFLPREMSIWKHLHHLNITTLKTFFEDDNKMFIVMERADKGDLVGPFFSI